MFKTTKKQRRVSEGFGSKQSTLELGYVVLDAGGKRLVLQCCFPNGKNGITDIANCIRFLCSHPSLRGLP